MSAEQIADAIEGLAHIAFMTGVMTGAAMMAGAIALVLGLKWVELHFAAKLRERP